MIENLLKKAMQRLLAENPGAVAELLKKAVLALLGDEGFVRQVREKVEAAIAEGKKEEAPQEAEAPVEEPWMPEGESAAAAPEASGAPALDWCWGGFNGSKAAESGEARIKGLRVTSSGLSYSWEKGGCEALGASGKDDAGHTLACLFLEDGRGGKFDWISTSRTSRSFENIEGRYNGWDPAAFKASRKLYFCVCSADGKRRTNLIEAAR